MRHFAIATILAVMLVPAASAQNPPASSAVSVAQSQPPSPVQSLGIAYVDLGRVAAQSALGKQGTARMNTLREKKVAELTVRNKELDTAQQKLNSGIVLTEDAQLAAQKAVARIQTLLQRDQQDAESEIRELQQQISTELERQLLPVLDRVARVRGLHLLLRIDSGTIAWADPALDLSAEVIAQLDAAAAVK
jgi:Skp family chaperone for outer membrane proteins